MLDEKGFDLWADGYDKSVNLSDEDNQYPFAGYKNVLNYIYNKIKKVKQADVLDVGFGTGILTKKLYDEGYTIFGIDFSSKMIEIAKEKMPSAQLVQFNFTNGLPKEMDNKKFDFIISTYALHHLRDSEKIKFIEELMEHLNENGSLLIGDIAFQNRELLNQCKKECSDEWDDEEFYFVYDELKKEWKTANISFVPISYCSGVIEINR